ncbi:MAG TPA: ATP-binding protein [Candidatus Aerophobetes bacterium]|uniref:Iron-sulfur cluster carrier protein n=1 Tax=Aerophobetes bacterium TaxID=2030807 RepID=A0A662DCG1_UNCAE|nr:MAG: ATP-binding protein [Candidatus Aerophobetes bacterium]HDN85285.1 ATP-binding protein [Candidatus Aerophobetes bacterium]
MKEKVNRSASSQQMQQEKIRENMKKITYKLMVISGKGGVGKSTIAVNLAFNLVLQNKKVGLLDVDIHGPSIAKMVGIEGKRMGVLPDETIEPIFVPPGLRVVTIASLLENSDTPVIWRGPLKMKLISQFLGDVDWSELDYLIIDSPPGTGDEPLSVAQLIPNLTGAIVVTTPQEVALLDSRKAVNFAKNLNLPVIGIIENMSGLVCPYCGKEIKLFKSGGGEKAARELGVPFLGRIPIDPAIVESTDSGKPFVIADKKGPNWEPMKRVVSNILKQINRYS